MPHGPGEFVTRFLGTNEYYWVNQRRCFAYRGIIADPIAVTSYNKSSYLSQDVSIYLQERFPQSVITVIYNSIFSQTLL